VEPVLRASSVRIDVDGAPAIDGLSLTSTGEHILVLGAASALFEACAALRGLARGELAIEGLRPLEAVRAGLAAGAPLDPPLPPRWTVNQYVTWSARLAGYARPEARELAMESLSRLQLMPLANSKLKGSALSVRRATVIAAALATGAPTLLLEDPLTGLPPEAVSPFSRALVRALADRHTVVFAGRMHLESPLALAADEAVAVFGSDVAAQGAPGEIAALERGFALQVSGNVRAFLDAVTALGGRLLSGAEASAREALELSAPAARIGVDLGPLATRDLLRIAADSGAVVLELRPIGRAFA
jgi:ABC-2 type transport system ATP-binding protein